jgi:Ca2+-binding EF-hand superfamily protein
MRTSQRRKSVVEFAQQAPSSADMRLLFARADVGKRGGITKPQLATLLTSLHVDASETGVNVLFQALDTDRNGVIDVEEFCQGMRLLADEKRSTATSSSSTGLRSLAAAYDRVTFSELFRAVDVNKDGKIDRAELRNVLESGGHSVDAAEFEALWRTFDVNHDNAITETEFHHGLLWINVHLACSARDPVVLLAEICRTLIGNTADTAHRAFEKGQGKTAKSIAGIVDLSALAHAETFLARPLLDAAVRKRIEDILAASNNA